MSCSLQPKTAVKVARSAIRRAVASSTAIETGQNIKVLEQQLKHRPNRRRRVTLAAFGTR